MEGQTNNHRVGAYVMICEKDAYLLDSFFDNARMMDVDVAWQLDHCSDETKEKIKNFERTVYVKEEDNQPYLEKFRRNPFMALRSQGYTWAFHWDMDERWDISAKDKFYKDIDEADKNDCKSIRFPMYHAWDGRLRIDTIFKPDTFGTQTMRERMYKCSVGDWNWLDPITVPPTFLIKGVPTDYKTHIGTAPIIHYGNDKKEMREFHKKRWDENYKRAVGRQPYGFWDYITDEKIEVTLADYKDYGLTKQDI